jgi:cytochrome c-type biogenesis protein CcmH
MASADRARPPGPTQDDVAAAADMSSSDRSDMIRGMVARLAEHLQENPDDLEGWERLARSYEVLGEAEKAENARMRAQILRDGVDTARPTSPQRGPSQEDIADAQDMSSEDRSTMIRNMVKGLAARLEENPSDVQGWIMLARSYQVLKQPDKTQDSLRRAQEISTDDPALLIQLGTAIVDASDQNGPLPADAITVFSRVLTLDSRNPDALYFMGMAHAQSGEIESARNTWKKLLSQLDAESRAYDIVRQQIDRLPDR